MPRNSSIFFFFACTLSALLGSGYVSACSNQLPSDMCNDLKQDGYCKSLPAKAAQFCASTCNLCGGKPKPKPTPPSNAGCGGANHLKRKANIAIFVSPTLTRKYTRKWRKDIGNALRSITIPALNRLFGPAQLGGGIDINFQLLEGTPVSQSQDNLIRNIEFRKRRTDGQMAGVAAVCEFAAQRRQSGRYAGRELALAIYLVDGDVEKNKYKRQAAGLVRQIGGVCKNKAKYNCGVVNGYARHEGLVFDRLLAHEIGHLMGFVHPIEEGRRDCTRGMMTSPGQYKVWSQCTKARAARIFSNPWEYPCLAYQCGRMPAPTQLPGGVSPADKRVLNGVCKKFYGDGKDWEYNGPMKFRPIRNPRNDIGWVLYQNPKWFLASRVCYGIPCKVEGGPIGGVKGQYMNGKPCGVGKVCKNKVYGRRVVSASCQ